MEKIEMCSRPSRGSTVRGSEKVDDTISKLLHTLGGTNTLVRNSVRRISGRIPRVDNRPTGNVHLKNIDKMVHSLRNGTQVSYRRVTGRPRTLSVRDRAQLAIKKIDRLVMSLSKPGTTGERVRAVGATPRQLDDFHTQDTPAKQQRITECVRKASKTSKPCTNHPGSIQPNVTLTKPEAVVKCVKDDIKIRKSSLCRHEEIKKPKTVSELQTEVERIKSEESLKSSPNLLDRTHTLAKPDSVIERIRRFEEILKPCTRRLEGIQTENKIPSPKTCVLKVRDDESFLTPTPSRLEEIGQKNKPQNNVAEDNKGSFENQPDLAKDDVKNRTWKILSSSCLVGTLVVAGVFVFSGLFSPPSPTLLQRALDVSISVLYPFVNHF